MNANRLAGETGLPEELPLSHCSQNSIMENILNDICTAMGPNLSSGARMTVALLCFLVALMVLRGDHNYHKDIGYACVQRSVQSIDFNYLREDLGIT